MLNKDGMRELAYLARVDAIEPIVGSDNCECAVVGGWHIMVRKNAFTAGDIGIYFEIDSKVDTTKPEFAFLASKGGKIKTQRYTFGGKGLMISQGLLMHPSDFGWTTAERENDTYSTMVVEKDGTVHCIDDDSRFLTSTLGVTYSTAEDNARKGKPDDKYKKIAQRHPKLFKKPFMRWIMKHNWGRKVMFFFFGKKKDKSNSGWPVGKFPGVSKTDQERAECMPWILNDKTPFIVTQKCDGSSGTYILERVKKNKFEFYVCSRNVRMMKSDQECFYKDKNYYWEVAIKYDIENKMRDYLNKHPDVSFVCWQGEICAPAIQSNPHHLKETHFYCFHMTDSKTGRFDIRDAAKIWHEYDMEVVPIVDENYIMPDDFEEFKLSADGLYDASVCEGNPNCAREGFVYYKTTDPTFSFKNVSRLYLLKH